MSTYEHLGDFSDWVDAARERQGLFPDQPTGAEMQQRVRDVLGFCDGPDEPADVRIERQWEDDGLLGEEVSWSVGYGPRTRAWVLRPAAAAGPLPGIVALHCHSGFKYFGKEKVADGPEPPDATVTRLREQIYGGRAFANDLARRGFVVLVPDTFLWGSRRFPLETMPPRVKRLTNLQADGQGEIERYNLATGHHEHLISKYCTVLGTTLAGVVAYEDRVATAYLRSRSDVLAGQVGCVGLSGGGCRAALLQATCDDIHAAVVVGMMSTYAHLLDHNIDSHTWMLFPAGLSRFGDWPDLAACRAPSPLLVQYDRDDGLFTLDGMQAADRRLADLYDRAGQPGAYRGEFYDGPHKFDREMQASAFAWLDARLRG